MATTFLRAEIDSGFTNVDSLFDMACCLRKNVLK